MKLKTKARILLGVFVVSGVFSQTGNFSEFHASGRMKGSRAISPIRGDRSCRRIRVTELYNRLRTAVNDRIRDRFLNDFDEEYHVSPFHSENCSCGDTLLHIAARDGNVEIFSYLLGKVEEEERICMQSNVVGRSVVHEAVLSGNDELVKVLVNKRAYEIDFEARDSSGKRPIDLANDAVESKGRKVPLLRIVSILTSAANVMRKVRAPGRCLDGVEKLVIHDTVNMIVDFNEGYPLPLVVYALDVASNTSFKVVYDLLGMGAERDEDVWNTTETDRWTNLLDANIWDDTVDELKYLLRILPFDASLGGRCIVDAVRHDSPKALKFLLENCMPEESDIDEALEQCAIRRCYDLAKMLINQPGYNLNALYLRGGRNPLHYFADLQDMDKVRFFLEIGADPNVRDSKGNLPIDLLKDDKDKLQFLDVCEKIRLAAQAHSVSDVPVPCTPEYVLPDTPSLYGSPNQLDYKRPRRG